VAVLGDGRIVVGGHAWKGLIDDFPPYNFGLIRLKPGGGLDPTFGGDGKVVKDFGPDAALNDLALQGNRRIVAAGTMNGEMVVARFRPGGSLDKTFSGDGRTTIPFGDISRGQAVAIQRHGRIIVGGEAGGADRDFAIAALKPKNGALDKAFSGDGMLRQDLGSTIDVISLHGIALQRDEKIVAAGGTQNAGTASDVIVMRVVNRDPSKTTLKIRKRTHRVIARGKVSPSHAGQRVLVTFLERRSGRFRTLDHTLPKLNSNSTYRVALGRRAGGRCRIVTKFSGDAHHKPSKARRTFNC